jgi:CheY-like chemotaxis protein
MTVPYILVAATDAERRDLYTRACAPVELDVVHASDGGVALAKALAQPPLLVIAEIGLPHVDGGALCEILHRDSATAAVPVLLVASEAGPDVERARRAGADGVLLEAAAGETILDEVRRWVDAPRDAGRRASARRTASNNSGRTARSKRRLRFITRTPSSSGPALLCPRCDRPLTYKHSHIGGVSDRHPEQWDYYFCPKACGEFQYRHRTRTLRRVNYA